MLVYIYNVVYSPSIGRLHSLSVGSHDTALPFLANNLKDKKTHEQKCGPLPVCCGCCWLLAGYLEVPRGTPGYRINLGYLGISRGIQRYTGISPDEHHHNNKGKGRPKTALPLLLSTCCKLLCEFLHWLRLSFSFSQSQCGVCL